MLARERKMTAKDVSRAIKLCKIDAEKGNSVGFEGVELEVIFRTYAQITTSENIGYSRSQVPYGTNL